MKTLLLIVGGVVLLLLVVAVGGWLYLRAPDIPPEKLTATYGRANSHYADLPGGVRLHYLESGAADAPVVLLVHGFGDNSFSWDGWTKALSPTHRVIAVDLPGHGLTTAPAGTVIAADRFADLLDAFAAKLGIVHLAVAGNSLGGGVAWNLAVRHPTRVAQLILVDAAGWPDKMAKGDVPLAFKLMRYRLGRDLLASIDNKPLIRDGLKKDVVNQSVLTEGFIQRWADLQRLPGHRAILMSLNPGSLAASDAVLAAVKVPTLILWGKDDQLLAVAAAAKFKSAIPHAEVIIYPGVGHLPQWEIPERSGADAAAFLARHKG